MNKKIGTNRLRNVMLIAIFLFSFILICILGFSLYQLGKKAIIESTFDQIASIRNIKKGQIEEFFKDRILEVEILSQGSDIPYLIDYKLDAIKQEDFSLPIIDLIFKKGKAKKLFIKKCSTQITYAVEYNESKTAFHLGEVSEKDTILEIWQQCDSIIKPIVTDLIKQGNSFSFILATPVYSKNQGRVGLLAVEISNEEINHLMLSYEHNNYIGRTGEAYLVGNDFLMRSKSRFVENSIMKTEVHTKSTINSKNKSEGEIITNDYRNIKVFSAYAPLEVKGLDWSIIVEIDYREAMLQLSKFKNTFFIIIILFALSIFVFSYFINRNITKPIHNLDSIFQNLDINKFRPIQSKRKDEIGSLFRSFNKMVAEIKEHRNEIKEREIRLKHFYEATTDGILLHEEEKIILVNRALSEITGFSEEELMKLNAQSLYIARNIGLKENLNIYESIAFRKNLKPIPAEIQHNIIDYEGRKINVCLIRDISKSKKVQEDLQKTEERFQLLIETLNEGIIEIDNNLNITYANPKITNLLGLGIKDLKNKGIQRFIFEKDIPKLELVLKRAKENIKDEMQLRLLRDDGSYFFARLAVNPIFDERLIFKGLIAAVSDVTEQVKAKESLQKSEDQLYAVFNYSPIMKFLINENLSVLTMNKSALNINSQGIEKRLGNIFDCINALSSAEGCGYHQECKNCKIRNAINYTFKTKQGIVKIEAKLTRIVHGVKRTSHFVVSTSLLTSLEEPILLLSIDDITDRKLSEKKLLAATIAVEEMERKRFAQDLHDELGPFLSGIKLFVSKFGDGSLSNDERSEIISELEELIDDAIKKTRAISNGLMPSVLEDFGLTGGLESFISKIRNTKKIDIDYIFDKKFDTIESDLQIVFYRIVIELINNTLKHANAETITIRLLNDNPKLKIEYLDDGIGFNFDQVISERKGLGLLNIINRLKNIDAEYKIFTTPGKGLIAEIELLYA